MTSSTAASIPPAMPTGRLLRVLGIAFGLAVTVGNTIGAGILRAPGEVAANVPGAGVFLFLWVAGALYAMLGALSLAELGAMIPRSGGQYAYARAALGEYAGFVVGWSDWISISGSVAAVSIVLADALGGLVPRLASSSPIVALLVIAGFTVLLWRGVEIGARAQLVTTILKAVALLALVGACFLLQPAPASAPGTAPPVAATGFTLAGIVLALQAVIYTYDGWTGAIYFSEEVRDPGRDIPRSMFGGVISVAAIYLLLNVAFLNVLPLSALAAAAMADTPVTAAAAVAEALFGPSGDEVVNALIVIALLSSVNALLPMAARVIYAMSTDRLFPRAAATVNSGGTPTIALAMSAAIAMAFVATGTFNTVIGMLAVFFVGNYVLSFTALFVLRRRAPGAARPYRAWGYPLTTGIALAGSVAFLIATIAADPGTMIYVATILLISYPAYYLMRRARGEQ